MSPADIAAKRAQYQRWERRSDFWRRVRGTIYGIVFGYLGGLLLFEIVGGNVMALRSDAAWFSALDR